MKESGGGVGFNLGETVYCFDGDCSDLMLSSSRETTCHPCTIDRMKPRNKLFSSSRGGEETIVF